MAVKHGSLSINSENIFPIIKKWLYSDHDIFVRELISKIQNLRKESGFEVQNHIEIYYSGNDKLAEIIERNKNEIADDTLADKIEAGIGENELDINGEKVMIKLVRLV